MTDHRARPVPGEPPVRMVKCPACGGPSRYHPSNPDRPFCSPRCRQLDLGAWASERFRLPAEAPQEPQTPSAAPFQDI